MMAFFISIPNDAGTQLASTTSTVLGDLSGIFALIGGIVLAFFVVEFIVSLLRGKAPTEVPPRV